MIDPNEMIDLSSKNGENIHPKMTTSFLRGSTATEKSVVNKYKIKRQNNDITSTRHECFCSNQYLSYTALYQHLKNKHPDFLKEHHRFSSTNMVHTTDPSFGYKIKKLTRERLKVREG